MKLRMVVLAVLAVATPMQAEAIYVSGNKLHELCASKFPFADGMATAYALGVADSLMSSRETNRLLCVPQGASADQAKDIVCNYLDKHPESRHGEAYLEALKALVGAWGCPKDSVPAK